MTPTLQAMLQAIQYIGIAMLLGGPAFWYFIYRPAWGDRAGAAAWSQSTHAAALSRRIRVGMAIGLILFISSRVTDLFYLVTAFYDTFDFESLSIVIRNSRAAKIALFQSGASAVFFFATFRFPTLWVGPLVVGLLLTASFTLTGHTAGLEVPLVYAVNVFHMLATTIWGGGLIYFALLSWQQLSDEAMYDPLARVARRFAAFGVLSVLTLAATGMYMGAELIHSATALTGTSYGLSLILKVSLFVGAIAVAGINHFIFLRRLDSPAAEERVKPSFVRAFAWVVRAESLILFAILLTTGVLTTRTPPKELIGVAEPVIESGRVGAFEYDARIEPGSDGRILITVELTDADGAPVRGATIDASLNMPSHVMEPSNTRLVEFAAGEYRGGVVLPMAGGYTAAFHVQHEGSTQGSFYMSLSARAGVREALRDQMTVRLTFERVTYSVGGLLLFLGYVGVFIVGIVVFARYLRVRQGNVMLAMAAILIVGGVWGIGSVVQVKAFPTAYVRNPVPRTAETIEEGRKIFEANCVMCHGPKGRGDGPLAQELQPPASDLTLRFTQMHTDGEFYWFITQGIPNTGMPAFSNALSEEETWTVIRYLRHLARERIREER